MCRVTDSLRMAVGTVLDWPVPHVAAAVVRADGEVAAVGPWAELAPAWSHLAG